MPTIYIKAAENKQCKITDFKDVTIVINYKKSICYMSFNVTNTGTQPFKQIEIVLPFCHSHISDIQTGQIEKHDCTSVSNSRCSNLLLTMWSPLEVNDTFSVELGFKVTLPKRRVEMFLHFFNLNLIKLKSIPNNPPIICAKTMKLYMILPKSYERTGVGDPANRYKTESISDSNKDIFQLISGIQTFFKDNKMFKRSHEVFEWDKKKISDLEDTIMPADEKRVIQFEFKKKNSVHIPIVEYDLSLGEILAIVLSVIGIVLAIIFRECKDIIALVG